MKAQTENDVVQACLQWFALHRVMAWRNATTGLYDPTRKVFRKFNGLKGVSDILFILPGGRFGACECKKKGGYPSPEQREFIQSINDRGGIAFVARSTEDLETHLMGLV